MTKSEKIVSLITPLYFKGCREAKSMLFNDLMNHHESKKLIEFHLRVDKAGSSFVYFTFEANEGLAFYSTLEQSIDQNHRDLIVYCAPEFREDLVM